MKNYSVKVLALIVFVLSTTFVNAQSAKFEDVHVLARIHSIKETSTFDGHAIELENAGLTEVLKKLGPDDEVLLKGYVSYRPEKKDTRMEMNPVFHIQSIHPVSLKELGISNEKITEPSRVFTTKNIAAPATIKVTPEVATAMTMTASLLMLQNLTASPSTPVQNQIQQATFLSAGVLATGYFIWKQLNDSKKKGSL